MADDEKFPVVRLPISQLKWQVGENHKYWRANDGESIGPYDLLKNWEAAQKNVNWQKQVKAIKSADFKYPIWICDMPDMIDPTQRVQIVIDGMHRLTKAIIEAWEEIEAKVIKFEDLPEETLIK